MSNEDITLSDSRFSSIGSKFSSSMKEMSYTLQSAGKKDTKKIIRGFYKKDPENIAGVAKKYFQGISLAKRKISSDSKEKLYLEIEIEHIAPNYQNFIRSIANILSGIEIEEKSGEEYIRSLLKPYPSEALCIMDVSAGFLFGDIPSETEGKLEFSTIEEGMGLQFSGFSTFSESNFLKDPLFSGNILSKHSRYRVGLLLDMDRRQLSGKAFYRDGTSVDIPPTIIDSRGNLFDNDVLFEVSTAYLHTELMAFLYENSSKYKSIIEQLVKYFKQAGTRISVFTEESDVLHMDKFDVPGIRAIDSSSKARRINIDFKIPNFSLVAESFAQKKNVVSIELNNDTGSSSKDLVTKVATQRISKGRLTTSLKIGERLFMSIDDGKTFPIEIIDFSGRNFSSQEFTLSSQRSSIVFRVQNKYGNYYVCETKFPYTYTLAPATQKIETIHLEADDKSINTKFKTNKQRQTIVAKLTSPVPVEYEIYGSVNDGKSWIKLSQSLNYPNRSDIRWMANLERGNNKICFKIFDTAGNEGEKTGIKDYTFSLEQPINVVNLDPFMYRYGVKYKSGPKRGASYEPRDWFENCWEQYLYCTEEFVYDSDKRLTDLEVEPDLESEQHYPVPTSLWDVPEGSISSDTLFSNQISIRQSPFVTNYRQQVISGTLNNALATGEKLLLSLDDGKTWKDLTSLVKPKSEMEEIIEQKFSPRGSRLVSPHISGHKQVVGYKQSSSDIVGYSVSGLTNPDGYSQTENVAETIKLYMVETYTQQNYSEIGGDPVEIVVNGIQSGRAKKDTGGIPVYKEVVPSSNGNFGFLLENVNLDLVRSKILFKIENESGNDSIVLEQPYSVLPTYINPISITKLEFSEEISVIRNGSFVWSPTVVDYSPSESYYFDSPGSNNLSRFIKVTFSRDLLDEEVVDCFKIEANEKVNKGDETYSTGPVFMYAPAEKVSSNTVIIRQIVVAPSGYKTNIKNGKISVSNVIQNSTRYAATGFSNPDNFSQQTSNDLSEFDKDVVDPFRISIRIGDKAGNVYPVTSNIMIGSKVSDVVVEGDYAIKGFTLPDEYSSAPPSPLYAREGFTAPDQYSSMQQTEAPASTPTSSGDAIPNPFQFTNVLNAERNTIVYSEPIVISGIDTESPISVIGGEYSINSGMYTASPGTVRNGDVVRLKVLSAPTYSGSNQAILNIGGTSGWSAGFSVITKAESRKVYVFTLMGQSNMVGYNQVVDNLKTTDSRIKYLNLRDQVVPLTDKMYSAESHYYELYGDSGEQAPLSGIGVGPGNAFAEALLNMNDLSNSNNPNDGPSEIILVPCARGGANVFEQTHDNYIGNNWLTGERYTRRISLVNIALERTQKALEYSENTVFGGVLYFQGETDLFEYHFRDQRYPPSMDFSEWGNQVNSIKSRFQERFGDPDTEMKFLFCQLATYPAFSDRAYFEVDLNNFRSRQQYYASTSGGTDKMILTWDLLNEVRTKSFEPYGSPDGLHLSHVNCSIVGKRLAKAWKKLYGASWYRTPSTRKTKIFLMMGQSNMVGSDDRQQSINKYASQNFDSRIKMLTLNNKIVPIKQQLYNFKDVGVPYTEGDLIESLFYGKGISSGAAFASRILETLPENEDILIIPCARGASSMREQLEDNQTGLFGIVHPKGLLNKAVEKVQYALAAIQNSEFCGTIYYQGETDSALMTTYPTEKESIMAYWRNGVLEIRRRLNSQFGCNNFAYAQLSKLLIAPAMPVFGVAAQTQQSYEIDLANWNSFKLMQEQFSASSGIPMIRTDDSTMSDHIHIDADSTQKIGGRFADAMIQHFL